MPHIADRVERLRKKKNSILVLGLDPNLSYFPRYILDSASTGDSLTNAVTAIEYFCLKAMDWISEWVIAIKPQLAYFELYGSRGLKVLENILVKAKEKDILVIMDAKRGDIGTTSQAYAEAFLGLGPLGGDFVTINPYLGSDSYKPFIEKANENHKGVFILLKTSNSSSKEIQDLKLDNGELLYEHLHREINQLNLGVQGNNGYSNVGFVVGATHPEAGKAIRDETPHNLLLIPGYGAQGGRAEDMAVFFKQGFGAMVNSSRGLLYPYLKTPGWEKMSEAEIRNSLIKGAIQTKEELEQTIQP